MTPSIWAFVGIAALLTIIPGADMALITKTTLADGRRAAFFTTLGICAGLCVHAVASALGLSAILRVSAVAYSVVKFAGGAYLIYLGVQTIRESGKRRIAETAGEIGNFTNARLERRMIGRCFRQGVFTNVLNPKVAVFYLTFLPQFVAPSDPVLPKSLALASIHIGMGLVWLTAFAHFLSGFSALMNRPAVKQTLERITGALLIGLGVRLAWERR